MVDVEESSKMDHKRLPGCFRTSKCFKFWVWQHDTSYGGRWTGLKRLFDGNFVNIFIDYLNKKLVMMSHQMLSFGMLTFLFKLDILTICCGWDLYLSSCCNTFLWLQSIVIQAHILIEVHFYRISKFYVMNLHLISLPYCWQSFLMFPRPHIIMFAGSCRCTRYYFSHFHYFLLSTWVCYMVSMFLDGSLTFQAIFIKWWFIIAWEQH